MPADKDGQLLECKEDLFSCLTLCQLVNLARWIPSVGFLSLGDSIHAFGI